MNREITLNAAIDLDLPTATLELIAQLRELHPAPDALLIIQDEESPMPWAVWDQGDEPDHFSQACWDILGAGEAMSEALAGAVATVRNWQQHRQQPVPNERIAQLEARASALIIVFEAATELSVAHEVHVAQQALRTIQARLPALWLPPASGYDLAEVWKSVLTRTTDRIAILLEEQLLARARERAHDLLVMARILGVAFEVECKAMERRS